MASPYGPGTNCVRWFFVICNFVFLALGAITTAVGIWGLVIGSQGDYDIITGDNTISAAAVLLSAGVITLVMAAVGICGAWGMWRPVLIIYTIAVLLIILLEITAAVLAFVIRDRITDELRGNMEKAIEGYRLSKTADDYEEDNNNAVANVQQVFQCCGIDDSEDWIEFNENAFRGNGNSPPGGCCCDLGETDCEIVTRTDGTQYNAWKDGCISLLEDNIRAVMLVIGVIGIVFAVIETLLMVLAISLCCCIRSTQKS